MTSAVASTPIKVELIEECSFIKEDAEQCSLINTDEGNEAEREGEEQTEKLTSSHSRDVITLTSSSGKNKAARPVLPELVIADTELFVKTLSDVVSDVLSQPALLSPEEPAPSSTSPDRNSDSAPRTKFKIVGTRFRGRPRSERASSDNSYNTTPPRAKRSCYKTPSPSPSPASSSSDQVTASPNSSDLHHTTSSDPLHGSSDPLHSSSDPLRPADPLSLEDSLLPGPSSDPSSSPSTSRPGSVEPGSVTSRDGVMTSRDGVMTSRDSVREVLRNKINSRTESPEGHAENVRLSQLMSANEVKVDPDNLAVQVNVSPGSVHKQHPCINCGKVFSQKLHLQRHIKSVHFGIRDNLCAFCGKGFMLKSHLMEHIRAVHFKIKNHVCLFCDWKFNRIGDLNRHVKTVHTNGKKPRKRRTQTQEGPEVISPRNVYNGKGEQKIIDVVSDSSDQDYSRDSSYFDQPLGSNTESLSPSEQAPLSLTDRYLSDYKKRLLEIGQDKEGEKNGNSGSDDLEIQEDEIVLFPSTS